MNCPEAWRRPHIGELWNVRVRWAGHVARMWALRNGCEILVGKTEGKKSLETHGHIWEDNIKMDLGK
jgi:hypothetical protein